MFCCFSPYNAVGKGNHGAGGQNHARITAYRVVQTLILFLRDMRWTLRTLLRARRARNTRVLQSRVNKVFIVMSNWVAILWGLWRYTGDTFSWAALRLKAYPCSCLAGALIKSKECMFAIITIRTESYPLWKSYNGYFCTATVWATHDFLVDCSQWNCVSNK